MAMNQANNILPAVILDATIAVSICSKEKNTYDRTNTEVTRCLGLGHEFFAPGVIVSETLFVLCRMLENEHTLTSEDHAMAIADFHTLFGFLSPPPQGEISLILRSHEIRGNYTCYRSSDSIYIALAEQLTLTRPTTLLTLDEGMKKQAAKNAPSVNVFLL